MLETGRRVGSRSYVSSRLALEAENGSCRSIGKCEAAGSRRRKRWGMRADIATPSRTRKGAALAPSPGQSRFSAARGPAEYDHAGGNQNGTCVQAVPLLPLE